MRRAVRRAGVASVASAVVLVASAAFPRAAGAEVTFVAVADAYVRDSAPTKSYGTLPELGVDASPVKRTFLRFTVAGLTQPVVAARLRLHTQASGGAASPDGGTLRGVTSAAWDERVTWSSQPPIDGPVLGQLGRVVSNSWYEVDVTRLVTGNGTFNVALTSSSADGADYDSRETANPPQLVLTTEPVLPPTAAPTTDPPAASPSVSPTDPVGPSETASPTSPSTTAPTTPTSGTTEFAATADASVKETAPTSSSGSSPELAVDGSPAKRTFLRFDVAGLTEPVLRAVLRLRTRTTSGAGSPYGGRFTAVSSTTWPESVTWDTQPALDGAVLGQLGGVAAGTSYEVDITPLVTGNGVFSLGITSANPDGADYESRDTGATGPRLLVTTGVPPSPTPEPTVPPGAAVLVGAGDIARCDSSLGDEATAALLERVPGEVFTLGDNAYVNGSESDFATCYDPTWGKHKARTRPALGNHEYLTPGAAGYFSYFGAAAGDPAKGYYSYDAGPWHVVVLNSNCSIIPCAAGSEQEQWLRADLAAHPAYCTLAYWHHPRYTSGAVHPPDSGVRPLFQALYDLGAELVLTAHNHHYERFTPMDAVGNLDPLRGVRQFVVGTGGGQIYGFGTPQPGSEAQGSSWGVLKLTLYPTSYEWEFLPVAGAAFTDSGSGSCH